MTVVSSGAILSGDAFSAGQSLTVAAGGTALALALNGATEMIRGLDSGSVVSAGGFQFISAGGTALGAIISGATQIAQAGGYASGSLIEAEGVARVESGGLIAAATIASGGSLTISGGGSALDVTLGAGGSALVVSDSGPGHFVSGIVASGGWLTVVAGGRVEHSDVADAGLVLALSGGTASLTVDSGGIVIAAPGAAVTADGAGQVTTGGAILLSGGAEIVSAPVLSGTVLSADEAGYILPGGSFSAGTVTQGATVYVFSGGASEAVTLAGGAEVISAAGSATGATITSQGALYVFSRGEATDVTVNGGFAIVDAGGSARMVTVSSGGNLSLDGRVSTATITNGGVTDINFGGVLDHATVLAGGAAYVFGTMAGAEIDSGSLVVVESSVPSVVSTYGLGGVLSSSTISGGTVIVFSGGTVAGDRLASGTVMLLESGATAHDLHLASGGTLIVLPGADDRDLVADSGAHLIDGGAVILETASGVDARIGGATSGIDITSGASAFVLSGTVASQTVVEKGGLLAVLSGGAARDTTLDAGATLSVASGATLDGRILFTGAQASIEDAGLGALGGTLSGFAAGDNLTFDMISGGGATVTLLSGNLLEITGTVSGGSAVVSAFAQLDPSAAYSAGGFAVSTTKTGAAEVTYGTVTAPTQTAAQSPVNIPLYVLNLDGSSYKIGIELSLDGGTTYKMYEFDTGGTGLYAAYNPAWWSDYASASSTPTVFYYTSGNTYTAQTVSTTVTFQTSDSNQTVATTSDIGLITSAEDLGTFTTEQWNDAVVGATGTAPLQDYFYGDFGVGLGAASNGIDNLLAQLGGGLSNGFVVTVGTNPGDTSGQLGNLQVGLTASDIASYNTLIAMQGINTVDTFANSGETSYQELLAQGEMVISAYLAGDLLVQSGGTLYSTSTNYVFDTGAPSTEVHNGTTLTSAAGPALATSGSVLVLSADGVRSGGTVASGWTLTETTHPTAVSPENGIGDTVGYVNTGLDAFWGVSVMFDLADGIIGFKTISCFAAGTRILTVDGPVAVQHLMEGQAVLTVSGAARPIRWIGHRQVDCARHPDPTTVWPVQIAANAFGPGLPADPLTLSPDHALYLEDVLIPVKHLIDGNVVRQHAVPRVTYYHIELDSHDVILAEGLPAETYLDAGQRAAFANGSAATQLHPRFAPADADAQMLWAALGYAPLHVTGPAVARARARLAQGRAPAALPAIRNLHPERRKIMP